MIKEKSNEFEKRILRTISCPQNKYIPRVDDAGKIFLPEPGYQLMHNGLKVEIDGYYGEYKSNGRGFVTDMLIRNKGVHEPQEERMFQEVLKYIPDNGSMLELGSYWAFYSMWFYQQVKNAECYMVEPERKNMEVGRRNFALNGFKGYFSTGKDEKFTKTIQLNSQKKSWKWLSVAASIVLLVSVYTGYENSQQRKAERIYNETQMAFSMLSSNLNKGNVAIAQLQYFENTKNKIFKQPKK